MRFRLLGHGAVDEPFSWPVLRDFAQDVMDAHLAQVHPNEMA